MSRFGRFVVRSFVGVVAFVAVSEEATVEAQELTTHVVMLGTGTPNSDPERSGPAVAVVVGEQAYLVDAGPGLVRRAAAAASIHDLTALSSGRLDRLFLTHLHSDHTVGLPDLIFTPWVLGRQGPLEIVGPPGTDEMVTHIQAAWRADVDMRIYGLEPKEDNVNAYQSPVREVTGGRVYEDDHVKIDAIPVFHGSWPSPLGYRFETADRVIVISGDARPSEAIVEACNGCDVLVHEVYSTEGFKTRTPDWATYHRSFHTSTAELAELAKRANPELLVLYHQLYWGATDDDLIQELRDAGYTGRVVSASDLGVY